MTTRDKLTVRLPRENLEFVKRYAAEHGITVTDVLNRYLTLLREGSTAQAVHPDVEEISGLVPVEVDAAALHRQRLLGKHQ